MEIQEYIENRLETQIEWYDKKAIHCRKYHENISVYCIIGTALSALSASISTSYPCYSKEINIFAAIIAFSVTVFLSIDKLKNIKNCIFNTEALVKITSRRVSLFNQGCCI